MPQPRARKAKAEAANTAPSPAADLLDAMKFITTAQKKESDAEYECHCTIQNGYVSATNGVIAVGQRIELDINTSPHSYRLLAALAKCGSELSIAEVAGGLAVKSGRFRVVVPSVPADRYGVPDTPIAPITDALRRALEVASVYPVDGDPRVVAASVLVQANTCVGTNGRSLLEAWHGIDLPPNLVLPKASVDALLKIKRPLAKFGYRENNSVTFWFEDGSWFKTQLFNEPYPNYQRLFSTATAKVTPPWLWEALDTLGEFSNDDIIDFHDGYLAVDGKGEHGATYAADCKAGRSHSIKALQQARPYITGIDFESGDAVYVLGENLRGLIMSIKPRS